MPGIFISYRKEDTLGQAAHLFKSLGETFGRDQVFMDVTRGQPGRDVREIVDEHLAASAVVLVVIGKDWAGGGEGAEQRPLHNPLDGVRIETAAALARRLPVIPVLVRGAAMVPPAELPADLADLAFRNPVTLHTSQWGSDVETLVSLLQSLLQSQSQSPQQGDAGADSAQSAPSVQGAAPVAVSEPLAAAAATNAAASAGERINRPRPVTHPHWGWVFTALAGVAVMALGLYTYITHQPPSTSLAVAKAQAVANVAVAQAEANKAEAQAQAFKAAVERDPPGAGPQPAEKRAENRVEKQAEKQVEKPARPQEERKTKEPQAPAPSVPKTIASPAKLLSFQKWTLNSSGCGAGPITVTGTARFSIEPTADGVVVSEVFRGSGSGYDVVVTARAVFSQAQPSYDLTTSGQWTGGKGFKTIGTDRVTADEGNTPRSANVVKFQSLCG